MYKESEVREHLDKAQGYALAIEDLEKHPSIQIYIATIKAMKFEMDVAAQMIKDCEVDKAWSYDGSMLAQRMRTPVILDSIKLAEIGLLEQICKTHPECVSVSDSKLRDTEFGSLEGYASKRSEITSSCVTDEDYKRQMETIKASWKVHDMLKKYEGMNYAPDNCKI